MKDIRVFVVGYYDAGNLGDELLLAQCQNILINHCQIQPEYTKYLFQQSQDNNGQSIYKKDYIAILQTIQNSDYIIFGGGSLFQDVTSINSLIYYSLLAIVSKLLNKQVILLAQGIGEFNSKFSELLAKLIYSISDSVSVREGEQNNKYIESWGLTDKVEKTVDLVWGMNLESSYNNNNNWFVNLRSSNRLSKQFLQELAQCIEQEFKGEYLYLVSFQLSDKKVLQELAGLIDSKKDKIKFVDIFSQEDFEQNKEVFNNASQAICMRYHALLLNILVGNNCYGISYDHKVSGLCQELGINYIDLADTDTTSKLDIMFRQTDIEQISYYRDKANNNIECLKKKLQH